MRKHEFATPESHEQLNDIPKKLHPEELFDCPLTQKAEDFINKLSGTDANKEALRALIQSEAFRRGEQISCRDAIHQTTIFERLQHQAVESIKKDQPAEVLRDLLNALRDGEFEILNKDKER